MMNRHFKLQKITLFNFYNYLGKQEVNLITDSQNNIFLFNILNGGGKTSLFHAIKWGFYGNAFDYVKGGRKMTISDFMNTSAEPSEGFFVELLFEYEGNQYLLKRQYKPPISKPSLSLIKDGYSYDEPNSSLMLDSVIPRNYGNFFMFDGEDLEQLSNAQNDSNLVEGVLQLIGLKEIKELRSKLSKISDEFRKDRDNALKKEDKNMESAKKLDSYDSSIQVIDDQLYEIGNKLNDVNRNIESLKQERDKYSNTEPVLEEINTINFNKGKLTTNMNSLKEDISKNSGHLFVEFIKKDIEDIIDEDRQEVKDLEGISELSYDDANVFEQQKRVISEHIGSCPICCKQISSEDRKEIESSIGSVESRYNRYCLNKKRIDFLHNEISFMLNILENKEKNIARSIERYHELEYAIEECDRRLSDKNKLLKDAGQDVVSEITASIELEIEMRTSLSLAKNRLESDKKHLVRGREDCIRTMKGEENLSSLSRKYDLCHTKTQNMLENLDKIIEKGIRSRREKILNNANTVFKKLTNKSDIYDRLEYESDDTYSFVILKKNGSRATNPSAGESQIVAMSFLIALTMCTERSSPILMDTPLAKLDEIHASNVGDTLASLDNQVLFLAQPMELSGPVMKGLNKSLAKQFISKLTEDNNAEIMEVEL